MNFSLLWGTWLIVAVVVAALALYRKVLTGHEDDSIHVRDAEAAVIQQQNAIAGKLTVIDRWGKILTVVALAYGLVVLGLYIYATWMASMVQPQVR